jgi:hypothetical protein
MRRRSEMRVRFTPEDDAKMLALSAEGKTGREIGLALGDRQASSVNNRLRMLKGWVPTPRVRGATAAKKAPGGQGKMGVVKCLGGCGGTFLSPDWLRIRICKVCKQRNGQMGLPDSAAMYL